MRETLAVGAGGALGSVLRHWLSVWTASHWPAGAHWATFGVNFVGSGVMGVLWALSERHGWGGPWRHFAAAGLCGGFTTFSAFSRDTLRLASEGKGGLAAAYAGASVAVSLAACWAGYRLASG